VAGPGSGFAGPIISCNRTMNYSIMHGKFNQALFGGATLGAAKAQLQKVRDRIVR